MNGLDYRSIGSMETHALRGSILHPNRKGDGLAFDGDRDAAALHLGAFHDGALVGVGTVFPEPLPDSTLRDTWRIVGMAVDANLRRRGIGAEILDRLLLHASEHGCKLTWCNSRELAVSLYRRFGFTSTPPTDLMGHEGKRIRMTCRTERASPVNRDRLVTEGGITRVSIYPRLSRLTIFKDTIHVGGLLPNRSDVSAADQTREVLEKIESLLGRAGSSKLRLVSAMVWLKDIATTSEVNQVWESWIPAGYAPARTCVQAIPGSPEYAVEVSVMAAL